MAESPLWHTRSADQAIADLDTSRSGPQERPNADSRHTDRTSSPLQENLDKVGRVLAVAAGIVVVLIAGVGVMRGEPLLEMFIFGVALAVAVVPEALPAVVTISLVLIQFFKAYNFRSDRDTVTHMPFANKWLIRRRVPLAHVDTAVLH